ncbi:MAG: ABC transporter ATP-binding protein [Clostridia bacterium]|nr:ABC transporter ATP-binding protein [Clostridia bacterium]
MTRRHRETKIACRGVTRAFEVGLARQPFVALQDIDLDIADGEFVCLLGPSGCGKSTLLQIIGGHLPPTSGEVRIDGVPVQGPRADIGIVFQTLGLFAWRTVLGNVEFGLEVRGVPAAERRAIAEHYLEMVGLAEFRDAYPKQLSGGMRQRVAIARALANDPAVLLLDEPFGALDAQTREGLQAEIARIWEKTRKTVVFVTHDIDEAIFLGDRVVVMGTRPGRVREEVAIDLPGPRWADERRFAKAFTEYKARLWSLLRDQDRRRLAAGVGGSA